MAAHGYGAATVAALVDEAGVPASSIYHYFGSKEGVLLAVMERGAERFFEALPIPDRRIGSQPEHLAALVEAVAATLDRNPDFLRLLVVMAAQPVNAEEGEVHRVVDRVRELALERLRDQMQVVFGLDSAERGRGSARSLRTRRVRRRLRRVPGKPRAQPRRAARAPADGADRGAPQPALIRGEKGLAVAGSNPVASMVRPELATDRSLEWDARHLDSGPATSASAFWRRREVGGAADRSGEVGQSVADPVA